MPDLAQLLQGSPYLAYTYAYPHKTAYRAFSSPLALSDLWAQENREAAFLYLHVPFCEMRCGFCNLFTTVNPQDSFVTQYLEALKRQARSVREQLSDVRVACMAIGGGTPTFLTVSELAQLFE